MDEVLAAVWGILSDDEAVIADAEAGPRGAGGRWA